MKSWVAAIAEADATKSDEEASTEHDCGDECHCGDTSGGEDEEEDEISPYSAEYLVQYGRKNWSGWVAKAFRTSLRLRREYDEVPSPALEKSLAYINKLMPRMLKVGEQV